MTTNSYFITGTDTGIGKTATTAALALALQSEKYNCLPFKPIQTGCERRSGILQAPDLDFVLGLLGRSEHPSCCPYRFEHACSPHLAAEINQTRIHMDVILEHYGHITKQTDSVLAEGAGGVMVPINEQQTMLDIMKALALPVIISARPILGTLNHTLMTIDKIRDYGCEVAGVVFVHTQATETSYIEEDNRTTIAKWGRVKILGNIPYFGQLDQSAATREFLTEQGLQLLNHLRNS